MFDQKQVEIIQKMVDAAVAKMPRQNLIQSDVVPQTLKDRHIDWNDINSTVRATQRVYKATNQVVNNSDVLQDDNDLFITVGANEIWVAYLQVLIGSGTTPDEKFGWRYPTGTTIRFAFDDYPQVATPEITYATVSGGGVSAPDLGMANVLIQSGEFGGEVRLQWSQNVANASDTTLYAGSNIVAFRLK